ncbi:hypothetical protein H0H92_000307 [Tricholoma furcatifolium]|nr:hypothetical protein H0H92_000307 [Tricholoma furcatifolium]
MEPNKGGEIWKHPNLVIAYVAQHAFHHIDQHLDKTPLESMLWHYQTGEDLEEVMKATRQFTEEEAQKMKDGSVVVAKVLEVDTREAQCLGLLHPLVRCEIEKHFAHFSLEPEFVSHNPMRGLSGGQKVKIVLLLMVYIDYHDHESLAALIEALKVFEGGVLVITHKRDFSESLCKEVWAMREGLLCDPLLPAAGSCADAVQDV